MQTSIKGRAFIESKEGLILQEYRDEAGIPTIGYGHVIQPGDPTVVSQTQADTMLANDLRVAESCINSHVTVPLQQFQFDALASFVFNCGAGAFAGSTMLRLLNVGDYDGASDQFVLWCHVTVNGLKTVSQNLLARREAERAMFRDEDSTDTDPNMKVVSS